jgi:hypothetical protein
MAKQETYAEISKRFNFVISEFMDFGNPMPIPQAEDGKITANSLRKYMAENDLLSYHRNYGWLMPCWEKIAKLHSDANFILDMQIGAGSCVIKALTLPYTKDSTFISAHAVGEMVGGKGLEFRDTIFLVIGEFVEWDNKQKKV